MKKSSRPELDREAIQRIVTLAREERKPFDEIKKIFGLPEKDVTEIMRKQLPADDFESWKKKVAAKKPKPMTQMNIIEDDELDSKYYIRNKF
ncbi:TIGR03643 family protein [Flavobacterium sp. MFBS3-15]|mgnify:CR=1|uniref:TIGR03643 family protein n=1 Tax=Flavobacterium sp. MFBS3-15 TaxID=2989816 RepID=UPI002235D7A3|nr:TIGR03643 family protein [Flavobacterium sp. MFBS3-15]MCW4470551.1 TIGR03643 family protein [Flavobacterium sp. MFBS3-15]